MTPRLTIDYGLRVQHSGSDFEVNNMNSGFFTDLWQRNQAARVYRLACTTGVPGQPGVPGGKPAHDRSGQPERLPPDGVQRQHRAGHGQADQRHHYRRHGGAERRHVFHVPVFHLAPRAGMAWNMTGDGKTALRGSWGIFYNFPRSTGDGGYPFSGGCPVSCTRQIRWATFDDITAGQPLTT